MDDLDQLIEDSEKCIEYYQRCPGHICPDTTLDLYATIANLARIVREQRNTK